MTTLTLKVSINLVPDEEGPGAKVNELKCDSAVSVCSDQEILVLDVTVDHSRRVASHHDVQHLWERGGEDK